MADQNQVVKIILKTSDQKKVESTSDVIGKYSNLIEGMLSNMGNNEMDIKDGIKVPFYNITQDTMNNVV